jgi:hypothetical protein
VQLSPQVRLFFSNKFFNELRSAAGDKNFKGISIEKKAKVMCGPADKILLKKIVACLFVQH